VVDIIKNRIYFSPLIEMDGKSYSLGYFQGDKARVNFIAEYSKETDSQNWHPAGKSKDPRPLREREG